MGGFEPESQSRELSALFTAIQREIHCFCALNQQLFQSKIYLNRHHDGDGMPVLHSRFETVGLDCIDPGLVESVAEWFDNARVLRQSGGVDNHGNKNDPLDLFLASSEYLASGVDVGMGEVMELAGFADVNPRVSSFGLRLLQSSDFRVRGRMQDRSAPAVAVSPAQTV